MIWSCRDKAINYGQRVLLMGIVNVTPDSFSDGGDWYGTEKALQHALKLEKDGADILDIGAQSTRPGHTAITAEEEWSRLRELLPRLRRQTKLPISVDTFYPDVAEKALEAGADIINDVSGTVSPKMAKAVKSAGAGWILMHAGGGSPADVRTFFEKAADKCRKMEIKQDQICFDMGIGFGKQYEEDLELLVNVKMYKLPGYPLMLGCSRKRVIGKSSGQAEPKKRTIGNVAADTAAILGGVDIIRLHNIEEEKEGILVAQQLKGIFSDD